MPDRYISLSCPIGSFINDSTRAVHEWFRGFVSGPEAMVTRLITKGSRVEYNYTTDEMKWISTMDGNLIIQKLKLKDAGFYTCHFTGSGAQIIELHVEGLFHWVY